MQMAKKMHIHSLLSALLTSVALVVHAPARAQVTVESTTLLEQRRQEERIDALRQREEQEANVRPGMAPEKLQDRLPANESPCVAITQVALEGDNAKHFQWALSAAAGPNGDDSPQGHCLGSQGLNLVLKRVQNALIGKGFITTRVGVTEQSLRDGVLTLQLTPGRIASIRYTEESEGSGLRQPYLWAAVPARNGDTLNLRTVEQALENYQRVPGAEIDIRIEPAERTGHSDLVIERRAKTGLRGNLSLDDSGVRASGKYQGNLTVAWDNPLRLNDLLYFSGNLNLGSRNGRGTDGVVMHYSAPVGMWQGGVTFDSSRNWQTVAGATQDYVYGGRHSGLELRLSRLLRRDGESKTSLSGGIFARRSSNHIDDTEVLVQRRRTGGWFAALDHRHYFGNSTIDLNLGYRRGTGGFGAISAPEQEFGEGTARYQIFSARLDVSHPFRVREHPFLYHLHIRGQKDQTRLASPQHFSIGGRYTVRGFDGETVLAAERGWLMRNTVSTPVNRAIQGWLAVDYGEVGGPTEAHLIGSRLAGLAVGIRGQYKNFGYELFAGTPLYKPSGFDADSLTGGFELNYRF